MIVELMILDISICVLRTLHQILVAKLKNYQLKLMKVTVLLKLRPISSSARPHVWFSRQRTECAAVGRRRGSVFSSRVQWYNCHTLVPCHTAV